MAKQKRCKNCKFSTTPKWRNNKKVCVCNYSKQIQKMVNDTCDNFIKAESESDNDQQKKPTTLYELHPPCASRKSNLRC